MRKVDQEILVGFIQEAKSYLPLILDGLQQYRLTPERVDLVEETHRLVHTIKGAASMVGLNGLSHMASQLEEALEEVAVGKLFLNEENHGLFCWTVSHLETYLDGTLIGNLSEKPLIMDVLKAYRRLRGLPEETPDPELDAILAELTKTNSALIPPKESTPPLSNPENRIAEKPVERESVPDFFPWDESPIPADSDPQNTGDTPELETDDIDPELLEVFKMEADEHLQIMGKQLPILEQEPANKEVLQDIRRSAHTLKGAAAMVGFASITQLAHRMEDLLDLLFEGRAVLTPEIFKLLFATTDALEDLASQKAKPETVKILYASYTDLFKQNKKNAGKPLPKSVAPEKEFFTSSIVPAMPKPALLKPALPNLEVRPDSKLSAEITPKVEVAEAEEVVEEPEEKPLEKAGKGKPGNQFVRVPIGHLDELVKLVSELVITRSVFEQRMTDFNKQLNELHPSSDRLRKVSGRIETKFEASLLGGGRFSQLHMQGISKNPTASVTFNTHSFDDLEFDRYTEFHILSRELVETTNDIQTVGGELNTVLDDFDTYLNRQARLTSEIEDKLMRLRMVPLATISNQLHRTVRNVAAKQNKEVDLVIEGEFTELDKNVLEEMADSFLHLLRNAVDHGIETPGVRLAKNKNEKGTIKLRASHQGSQVVIQIQDDGKGVDVQAIRATAIKKGMMNAKDAARLSEEDLFNLVFIPGFSTASAISEISGRGVGLDVVKSRVHKLKGNVTLSSELGKGTTFTIRLPMTLAVTRALLVKANQENFAIPLDSIEQILRMEKSDLEWIGSEPVLRVQNKIHPLAWLGKTLNLKQPAESQEKPPVIILNLGSRKLALVVDQLLGGKEIVIKNMGSHLRRVNGITGATLMGDGSVVLILNPHELVREGMPQYKPTKKPAKESPKKIDGLNILVVDDSPSVRRIVTHLLKNSGINSVTAKDGLDALGILNQQTVRPDVIMLDIEMPRMDGYELLSTLKSQEQYRDIPVVMVTSRSGEKHRKKAMDLGASVYLVKPYQDETMIQVIRSLAKDAQLILQ